MILLVQIAYSRPYLSRHLPPKAMHLLKGKPETGINAADMGRVEHPCSTARPTKDGQPYLPATCHPELVSHLCTFARGIAAVAPLHGLSASLANRPTDQPVNLSL